MRKERLHTATKRSWIEYNGFCAQEKVSGKATAASAGKSGVLVAERCFGCDSFGGELKRGIGVKAWALEDGNAVVWDAVNDPPKQFFLLRQVVNGDEVCVPAYLSKQGVCFIYSEQEEAFAAYMSCGERGVAAAVLVRDGEEAREKTVLFASEKLYVLEGNMISFVETEKMECGEVLRGRVFAYVAPRTLLYSAPNEPLSLGIRSDVDGSGRLFLPTDRGQAVALQAFENKLYIFFERGISRLTVGGSAKEFVIENVEYGGGKIVGSTVGAFGKQVVFMAEDGLYFFDGAKAERKFLSLNIQPSGAETYSKAVADGKFLLGFVDGEGAKTAVLYPDGENGYVTSEIVGLSSWENVTFCYANGRICEVCSGDEATALDDTDGVYAFISREVFFARGKRTLLRGLELEGDGACDVTVWRDGGFEENSAVKKRKIFVTFTNGKACARVMMRGEKFRFLIEPKTGGVLRRMRVETEIL
ncbi:MAG: PQQ-like beta-propeller repeat protein [Clostridia bacterium]|nr:PQQ-like beta-propeller repeat protein [Clostridia bacterium]